MFFRMVDEYGPEARIHQPFSRTFFVFFSKICKFNCNTTSDWLKHWVNQSNVVLHSNAAKYRNNLKKKTKNVLENG